MEDLSAFIQGVLEDESVSKRTITVNRNQFLTRFGEVERHMYWVKSGALRAVYVNADEEHTIRFGHRGSIINSLFSYFMGTPAILAIQAIRKTEVYAIPKGELKEWTNSTPERMKTYQRLLEMLAVQLMERELDLLTSSPTQRVKRVMERSPQVFQEIPAKYIAAYLRMTPETLSRLRAQLEY